MGRTYSVPRNVKGESRVLYVFTVKSFITTAIGGLAGLLVALIFFLFGLDLVAWIIIAIFALFGFIAGALTIPDVPFVGNLRKAGGERVGDILFRTLTFLKRKKIYVYRGGNK